MTASMLLELFTNEEAAFQFALQSDMLYVNGQCEECDGSYQLYTDEYKKNQHYLKCTKCSSKRSILHNSIFTRTKLKINVVLHLLYC